MVTTTDQLGIIPDARAAALRAARWCAVASLFVVSINKPATNVALGLCILLSVIGTDSWVRWRNAWDHPFVRGMLVWWAVLMISALHTWYLTSRLPLNGSFVWACGYPLALGSVLDDDRWRRRALTGFGVGVGIVLLLSCGMAAGLVPQRALVQAEPHMRDTVFKEYTQQGLATLIFGSMALASALATRSRRARLALFALAALALLNVCFMLQSRTAYLVLVPVAAYWVWRLALRRWAAWKAFLSMGALGVAIAACLWTVPLIRDRLVRSVQQEVDLYQHRHAATSAGIRLELWKRTLPMIASAPLFGNGLHQWFPLYQLSTQDMADRRDFLMGHPHQEMLLILAEQGFAGLMVYLLLLGALARYVARLGTPQRDIYACILLTYLVAGLANCLWADFTHRHTFLLLFSCLPLAAGESLDSRRPGRLAPCTKEISMT